MGAKIVDGHQSFKGTESETCLMRRVVIVEDDPIVLHFLHRMLSIQGYDCLAFQQEQEALQCLRAHRPALIITGDPMPSMTIVQFLEHLYGHGDDAPIPVILLTNKDDRHDVSRDEAKRLGVQTFLAKPLDYRKISVAVETALPDRLRR
ncbi:MAG: response regulator [Nitrospirales bacterium]|nr:response regulator [Nitrospira sp.]MDR4501612.1 response regulator [Nitrospirales bacterium]